MTKEPLPLPRCTLYVRTTSVKKASEIIESLTGIPPYKNHCCEHNVGVFGRDDDPNVQFNVTVNGDHSTDDWKTVFMFFQIAGQIAQYCRDTEIGFQVFGGEGSSSLWVSDTYRKRILNFNASKKNIEASILSKFNRIQAILEEGND